MKTKCATPSAVKTYKQRAALTSHPITKKLFLLMEEKETNLCFNPDLYKASEILDIADKVGPEICVLKTHIDIIEDFSPSFVDQLIQLSEKHRFFIFEDRKFADIGTIAAQQYQNGMYRIADWAHIVDAHTISGPGVIEGLRQIGLPKQRGLLLLAQMSSKGSLITEEYTAKTLQLAQHYKDFVMGFICREKITDDPIFIHFTPGIQKENKTDPLGQQYLTPKIAIQEFHTDIIIVGRGIYHSPNPKAAASAYRQEGWTAYQERLST